MSVALPCDTIVDNLYILSLPPQFNQTIDVGTNFPGTPLITPEFLANGGIPPTVLPGAPTDLVFVNEYHHDHDCPDRTMKLE